MNASRGLQLCIALVFATLCAGFEFTSKKQLNAVILNVTNGNCRLVVSYFGKHAVKEMLKSNTDFIEYHFDQVGNYATNPLQFNDTWIYKSTRWIRTTNPRGPNILNTIFSLYGVTPLQRAMSWVVTPLSLQLSDQPTGCVGKLASKDKEKAIIRLVVDDFGVPVVDDKAATPKIWICYQLIDELSEGSEFAQFAVQCCQGQRNADIVVCYHTIFRSPFLGMMLNVLRAVAVLCGPLLTPSWVCRMVVDYIVRLRKPLHKTIWISRAETIPEHVIARNTLDLRNSNALYDQFNVCRNVVCKLPAEKKLHVYIKCYNLRVDDNELLTEKHCPLSVAKSIVNSLFLCNGIKKAGVCRNFCESQFNESSDINVKWIDICNVVGRIILVCLIPTPYYICLYLYYMYEYPEILNRRRIAGIWNLKLQQDYWLDLGPASGIHITACVLFLAISIILVSMRSTHMYARIHESVILAIIDMRNVSVAAVMERTFSTTVKLLHNRGTFGCLLAIVILPVLLPGALVACIVYSLPLVFLSWRIAWYMMTLQSFFGATPERRWDYVGLDKNIASKCWISIRAEHSFRRLLAIAAVLTVWCSLMLLLATVVAFTAKLLWLVLIEAIVSAVKYSSIVLALVAHAHDCYSTVYLKYTHINQALFAELKAMLKNDVDEHVTATYDEQENRAFKIKREQITDAEVDDHIVNTTATNRFATLQWDINRLLFFVDKSDYPRIPRKLFDEVCQIRTVGSVGPPVRSMVKATMSFAIRIVFLGFIYMTIFMVGDSLDVSSNIQLFTSLTGAFLPLMIRFFLKKQADFSMSVSFRCHAEEIIKNFRDTWPMCDLQLEPVNGENEAANTSSSAQNEHAELDALQCVDILLRIPDGEHIDEASPFVIETNI